MKRFGVGKGASMIEGTEDVAALRGMRCHSSSERNGMNGCRRRSEVSSPANRTDTAAERRAWCQSE